MPVEILFSAEDQRRLKSLAQVFGLSLDEVGEILASHTVCEIMPESVQVRDYSVSNHGGEDPDDKRVF